MMNLKVTESFDGKENKLGKDMTSLEWQAKSFTWQNLDILQEEDISNQEEDEEISTKVGAVTSPDIECDIFNCQDKNKVEDPTSPSPSQI